MRATLRTLLVVVVAAGVGVLDAPASAAGGGGCHRQAGPTDAAGTSVELDAFCMTPSVVRVEPGDVVTFTNRDPVVHNLIGSGLFVDELVSGASVAFRFDDAGTYPYACTLHPGMVGAVAVGDGRRIAPESQPITPVEVQRPAAAGTSVPPVALETEPLGATAPAASEDEGIPLVPTVLVLVAVGGVAYLAGRRRRAGVTPS